MLLGQATTQQNKQQQQQQQQTACVNVRRPVRLLKEEKKVFAIKRQR